MESWVTIHAVELAMDAYLIRSRLEMELDIEVLILDELSAQAIPFAASVIGGVRIQVREDQVETAREFLIEHGYIKNLRSGPNKMLSGLAKFTEKIPIIKNLRVEARILLFVAFLLALIIIPVVIYNLPSTEESFKNKTWCIQKVVRFGELIEPRQKEGFQLYTQGCEHRISFADEHLIDLPRYNDSSQELFWNFSEGQIHLYTLASPSDTSTTPLLEGDYDYSFNGNQLTLESKNTRIICSSPF